jgi:hypothetical protein
MPISTKLLAGGLAGAALLLSAGAALAEPGQATASVNVRSGPGVGYAVLDTLYPGEGVDIQRCDGGWCYVVHSGPDGWVSANYLAPEGGGYAPPPPPAVIYEPEYVPAPIFITPGFHHRHRPPPPIHRRPPPPPFHHRHGNPPPWWIHHGGPPPGVHPGRPHYAPPPGIHHNGPPPSVHHNGPPPGVHHNGPPPGKMRPPRGNQSGGKNPCVVDPKLCMGGPHHH